MSDLDLDAIERAYGDNYLGVPWVPHLVAEVKKLRGNLGEMEDELQVEVNARRRATSERDALRERVATLEGGIKRTADFIRDQDRVMAGVLDALLDAHDQERDE